MSKVHSVLVEFQVFLLTKCLTGGVVIYKNGNYLHHPINGFFFFLFISPQKTKIHKTMFCYIVIAFQSLLAQTVSK